MIRDRYHKLIKPQPLVAYLSIYTGFLFAMMFSFFASFNYVFQLVYHFNQKEIDLTFIGIIIDYIFARLFLANNWLILGAFGWGNLSIFISAIVYLVGVYQSENGASAGAANGILRYIFGAAFPLFTIQMYDAMGIHWAGSVFAFVSVAMMPVPWIFYWKGKALRARSYYNTSKDQRVFWRYVWLDE
ncbi:hypothetical protein V8E51_017909 [Hyaloscypha variabilis]